MEAIMALLEPTNDVFAASILRSIREEVAKIADEEAALAAERVRSRVRARINEISVHLMDHFSMERMGRDLVIRVKHELPTNGGSNAAE
jgi:hypothetical protein